MLWIKRNLLIVIGGAISLCLLGGAGYYTYNSFYDNDDQDVAVEQLRTELQSLTTGLHPNEANIEVVRSNTVLANLFMDNAEKMLNAEPPRSMNAATFSIELIKALDRLKRDATNHSVELPPRFDFTFGEIKQQPRIFPYAVEPLNGQLADISSLCSVLYRAKVRAIDSLHRVPAYLGEPPSADLIMDLAVRTNEVSTNLNLVITPYRVTFRGFAGELTAVLNGLARTKDFIVIRQIDLDVAGNALASAPAMDPMTMQPGMQPGMQPLGAPVPGGLNPGPTFGLPPPVAPPMTPGPAIQPRPVLPVRPAQPGAVPPPAKSTLTPLLDEKPLRVTLVLDFIKAMRRPAPAPVPVPVTAPAK